MLKKMSRKTVAVAILGAVFGIVAIASAAFTTNSQPWADAQVATASHPNAWASVQQPLYPGHAEDVVIGVQNTNPVPVIVTGVSHVGYRNVSDVRPSLEGNANRLEDFLVNNLDPQGVNGTVINPGETVYLTLTNAVGLESIADDASQGATFESGYFVAFELVAGNEVP